ncbi:MAG: TonB-dependent receptor [Gammaproteobacteria bacterium]|nr:TonB-dependent receptor [Gammaproteobacteria bacterium]
MIRRCLLLVIAAMVLGHPAAWAQEGSSGAVVEEIMVTARKVTESLQDVPVSIMVMSGDRITEAGITKIENLVPYLPNFAMSETGIGTNLYVRGIGSGINQGFEQSVGMYIDGIYYGRAQLIRAPFLDLAQVEALRGPQVTLLGNNSIAGALILTTAKPTEEFETSINALIGEDGEGELTGVLSGPLFSNLSARLTGRYRTFDGYLQNNILNRDEPEREETSGRLLLAWNADTWDATLKLERNEFDITGRQIEIIRDDVSTTRGSSQTGFSRNTGSAALWQPGLTYLQYLGQFFDSDPRIQNGQQDFIRGSNEDRSENTVNAVVLNMNFDIGEHEFTSVTGYLEYDYTELCDCDFTGADQFRLLSEEDYWQFSQELRLTSPQGERLRYMVGLYYQQDELDFGDQIFLPVGSGVVQLVGYATTGDPDGANASIGDTSAFRDFRQNAWNSAIFGQLGFDITDRWRGNLGMRYAKIEKEAVRILQEGDLNRRAFELTNPVEAALLDVGATLYSSIFEAAFHQLAGDREEDQWSFELVTEFDATDDIMLYGSIKKGNKSGGFDVRSNSEPRAVPGDPCYNSMLPLENQPIACSGANVLYPDATKDAVRNNVRPGSFEFEDEEALAYEIGSKMILAGGAADLSIALFRTEFDNLQVSIFDGTLGFNVGNAAEATSQGVELDGRWRINESWMLNGSLAYLDFEFDNFPNGQCRQGESPTTPGTDFCDYSGKTNQYVAPWSGSFALNYERQFGNFLFRGNFDLLFTDAYEPSQNLDSRVEQDAYAKINARVALGDPDGRWEIAVLGRNLTDESIVTYANDTPLAFSQFGSPSWYGFMDRPRSFALQGVFRFP